MCGGQRSTLNVLLNRALPYFWRQGLSPDLEFNILVNLAASEPQGSSLFHVPSIEVAGHFTMPGLLPGWYGSKLRSSACTASLLSVFLCEEYFKRTRINLFQKPFLTKGKNGAGGEHSG